MTENFFGSISTDRLKRGAFRILSEQIAAIKEYIAVQNQNLQPLVRTAKANNCFENIAGADRRIGSKKNKALR